MTTGMPSNPKDALIAEVQGEYEQIQKRLKELQSLIDQSQAEVRRLQQRSIDVTTQVNRLEANFDTVPRNDIKVIYNTALDTRARLLTVQSQLEKFQQDHTHLEHFKQLLENLLKMIAGVPASGIQSATGTDKLEASTKLSNDTIIRIVQSQESERQRLARHMHDGPAQALTNFILQAEICRRLFDRNPDRAGEELDNLKAAASTTFKRVRDFIFELRPMMLDDLGLAPTMRRYIDVFAEKSGIETQINIVGEERRRLESYTEVMMFRSLQEMLGYTRDTSGATKVEVVLDISGSPVKATLTFNGKGPDLMEINAEQDKTKLVGVAAMIERIELLGGKVEIRSGEGDENRVEITLPTGQTETMN
jgi:two-component system sensor histidine kinase DegS